MNEETTRPSGPGFGRDKDFSAETGGKFRGKRRRKVSYLTLNKIDKVDYKEVNILRRFINDRGKMVPSRQSGNTAKQQRMIARAIRRARELALLPFVVSEMGSDRREFGPRRDRGDRGPRYDRGDRYERSEPPAEQAPAPEAAVQDAAPAPEAAAPEAAAAEQATE
jgi:small subunit ribosomal protein S18